MLNLTNPPQFDPEVYTKIALNDLVVYAMYFLHTQGVAITSEDIISASFTLFPKRFSLVKYPYWPDAAVVSRRWSECRRKGYLVGSVANGFKLTPRGFKFAEKVEKTLGGTRPVSGRTVPTEMKTRAGKFMRSLENSDAYRDYKKHGKASKFNDFDVRTMLLCTMESPPETLKRNLDQFKDYAEVTGRREASLFLEFTEHKFAHLFTPHRKASVPSSVKTKKAKARAKK